MSISIHLSLIQRGFLARHNFKTYHHIYKWFISPLCSRFLGEALRDIREGCEGDQCFIELRGFQNLAPLHTREKWTVMIFVRVLCLAPNLTRIWTKIARVFAWANIIVAQPYNCLEKRFLFSNQRILCVIQHVFFLSGRLKWSPIYPQQPVKVGSSPDLFVICSFTTSSAHVGWIPTVADKVLYVRPHLERTHTRNLWETLSAVELYLWRYLLIAETFLVVDARSVDTTIVRT